MRIVLSVVALFFGVFWVRQAIRGRLVSSNPHCGGCKFDLVGLELGRDSVCPECGQPTIPRTPMVSDGLRKRRPKLAVLAILLILLGSTGLAWPKVSQMPTIKNIDWYAKFPEGLLIRLTLSGNDDALQELHGRLIPGTLSDESLQTLITHALAMIDDESQPWDEQWGDVLVVAMLEERIAPEQMYSLIEKLLTVEIEARSIISNQDQSIVYRLIVRGNPRGASVAGRAGNRWQQPISKIMTQWAKVNGDGRAIDLEINFEHAWIGEQPKFKFPMGSHAWIKNWAPVSQPYTDVKMNMMIPQESSDQIILNTQVNFTLKVDGDKVYHWSLPLKASISRSSAQVQYAIPQADTDIIDQFVQGLSVGYIPYPTKRSLGRMHFGTKDCYRANIIHIHHRSNGWGDLDIAMLFDASVAIDGDEIKFARVHVGELRGGFELRIRKRFERNVLDVFDRESEFWEKAYKRGSVDLILRPNPDYAQLDPRFKAYLEAKVIFRNVPLMVLMPKDTGKIWTKTGEPEWRWVQENRHSYTSIPAEVLRDDG